MITHVCLFPLGIPFVNFSVSGRLYIGNQLTSSYTLHHINIDYNLAHPQQNSELAIFMWQTQE